uniref:Uncharacterized protein n=1 Tax=Tanacetum cinerariifolium TaxID=118510 RepID=A0A699UBY1_TANCI|nr:hypothetical protein [Tanacetum cinerariifolium]
MIGYELGLRSEDFKDLDGCGESNENKILGTIINKLHDEWFKGTDEDDDYLESIGPGEVYTKMKVSEVEELSRTRGNIANVRAEIMEEILGNDDEDESYDET